MEEEQNVSTQQTTNVKQPFKVTKYEEPPKPKFKLHRIFRGVLFVVIGIWAIVLSHKIKDLESGGYEMNQYYGGDAYTGMQHASARTSKNTHYGNIIIRTGFEYGLLITGLGFLACGVTGAIKKD